MNSVTQLDLLQSVVHKMRDEAKAESNGSQILEKDFLITKLEVFIISGLSGGLNEMGIDMAIWRKGNE